MSPLSEAKTRLEIATEAVKELKSFESPPDVLSEKDDRVNWRKHFSDKLVRFLQHDRLNALLTLLYALLPSILFYIPRLRQRKHSVSRN